MTCQKFGPLKAKIQFSWKGQETSLAIYPVVWPKFERLLSEYNSPLLRPSYISRLTDGNRSGTAIVNIHNVGL
jgi:hypothetical protein